MVERGDSSLIVKDNGGERVNRSQNKDNDGERIDRSQNVRDNDGRG